MRPVRALSAMSTLTKIRRPATPIGIDRPSTAQREPFQAAVADREVVAVGEVEDVVAAVAPHVDAADVAGAGISGVGQPQRLEHVGGVAVGGNHELEGEHAPGTRGGHRVGVRDACGPAPGSCRRP